jgi:hypothetical protein
MLQPMRLQAWAQMGVLNDRTDLPRKPAAVDPVPIAKDARVLPETR